VALYYPATLVGDEVASPVHRAPERPGADGAGRPRGGRICGTPAWLAAAIVGAVVAADALLRCLNQTSRLTRETRQLSILSRTDPLTALPNRRHVEEGLAAAVSAARRHHDPLSVLFVDIDDFKRINDQSGYEAGDDVLRNVGERVRLALRTEDLFGRWGGEEFVAVLPMTDLAGAVVVAERVRAAIASHPVVVHDRESDVTVSVGCASGGGEPADLVRQASRALRQAKLAGKNQVVAADPPE
jgi:diguanylate cyclase (GGDEF)-like protein